MANAVIDRSATINEGLLKVAELLSHAAKQLRTIAKTVQKAPSQAWFWTEKWQKMEREADEDIRMGRYKTFDSVKKAIKYLNN